jgi:hypothetical protein
MNGIASPTSSEPEYFDDELHLGLESFIGQLMPATVRRKGGTDVFNRAG